MDANKYKFNLQPSPVDPRDFMLEAIYPDAVTLPAVWDLRKNMRAIRDQGAEGSCSAQTVAAMKEWQEFSDVGLKEHMSPWFVYQLRSNAGQAGMTPRDTMEILYKIGITTEADYPYLNNKPITDELKSKAANYKIQGYAQINTLDSLKKALFGNGPCYIAFPVYNPEKMEFWKPDYIGQPSVGGHATCVAGYTKDSFIIRNSWSYQWGDQGYTYYPFSQFGMHWEIWTAIDADSNSKVLSAKANNVACSKSLFRKMFRNKVSK